MRKLLLALCLIAASCSKDEPPIDSLNSYSPPELFLGHTKGEVIAALGEPDRSFSYEDNTRFSYTSNMTGINTIVYHFIDENVLTTEVLIRGSQDNLNFIKDHFSSIYGTPLGESDFGEFKVNTYPVFYPLTQLYFNPNGSKIIIRYTDRKEYLGKK